MWELRELKQEIVDLKDSFMCHKRDDEMWHGRIRAGICAQLVADRLGEIGPFQAAILLTVLALFFVVFWEENYGSSDEEETWESESSTNAAAAFKAIVSDRKIFLTGLVNSLFEGSMYSFVFMWVPSMLQALNGSFMTCMSLGGLLFSPHLLLGLCSAEQLAVGVFLVGAAALAVPVYSSSLIPVLLSFIIFETCVGVFFPCLGLLRSKVIPDSIQGSVMNIFRVPLNIFVVIGTKLTDIYPPLPRLGEAPPMINRMHLAHGLPLPVDFQLLQNSADSQVSGAIFRYEDQAAADGALEVFSGLPVEYNGRYWPLCAKPVPEARPVPEPVKKPAQAWQQTVNDTLVLLREVPADWSQKDLLTFHQSLAMEEFQTVKLMQSVDGGVTRHRCVVSPVAWCIRDPENPGANGAKARPQGKGSGYGYRNQAWDQHEPGPFHDPYTLYLSDMPKHKNSTPDHGSSQDLERLHEQLGLVKPKSIKVLYLRLNKVKGSAVLRYETTEQAKSALMMLQDRLVLVNEHSGEEQHPRAQKLGSKTGQREPAAAQEWEDSFGGSDREEHEEESTVAAVETAEI
eukprot:g28343.t1